MFDLIAGKIDRPLRHQSPVVTILSVLGHIVAVAVVVGVPLLLATTHLPDVPTMMAFVAPEAPVAPPPPPPPAPAAERRAASPKTAPVTTSAPSTAAPVEAPAEIRPEPAAPASAAVSGGVAGGVEGGVAGGIVGGLAGAVVTPPPPPPPPPPAPGPVRIGGQLTAPALLSRTEPDYPDIAVAAKVQGMVILEASVDMQGRVTGVKVLRSVHFLDSAAIDAVKAWKYAPLTLNGVPTPFVITVTVNFSLGRTT